MTYSSIPFDEWEDPVDKFYELVGKRFIEELMDEDDLEHTLEIVDKLVSEADNPARRVDDLIWCFHNFDEYEKAMIVYNRYSYLSEDYTAEILREEFRNDLPDAHVYGKLTNNEELAEEALDCMEEDTTLLKTYENCCEHGVDAEEIVNKLTDPGRGLLSNEEYLASPNCLLGEFCNLVIEYQEPHLAYHLAGYLYEKGPGKEPFVQWIEGVRCFAEIGKNEEVLDEIKESSEIRRLSELVGMVKELGEIVESFYGIEIPHLKNIRFKPPTGSYGTISRYGMMKKAVGE